MPTAAPAFDRLVAILATAAAVFAIGFTAATASAQTTETLDGTSGSNSVSTTYTTTGGLTLDLGFFVDYLVVGGGGAGTTITSGYTNGGGGGDVETGAGLELISQSYAVAVGNGGAYPGTADAIAGSSSALGVTAAGGRNSTSSRGGQSGSGQVGGTGSYDGSGGGGAGGAGTAGTGGSGTRFSGSGGIGVASDITGSQTYYGGGGAGGYPTGGTGGLGGGGNPSVAGAANTGGGGGGYAAGGSGVVIIRYAGASVGNIGGEVSSGTGTATGTTLHTFKITGPSAFNLGAVDFNTRLGVILTTGVSGTGDFAFNGPGTLSLAADSSYVGDTTISAGTLRIGNGGSAGSLGNGSVTNNSVLAFDRSDAAPTVANTISGTGSLVHQGSGTTTLSAANTFTGSTRLAAGTLALGHVDALAGSTLDLDGADAGGMSFAAPGTNTYSLGGLAGSRSLANGGNSLSIGGNDAATTYSGLLSGAGGLTKTGAGTLTLSGTNTYGGPTTVSGGTLRINGDQSGAAAAVTVATGGTLGGSGTVGGATTLQAGGTLAPGNSPGTLTMASDLTWNGGANYNWQLVNAVGTAGTDWDLTSVTGTLDVQASSGTPFNLNLWTLSSTGPDVSGNASNFDRTTDHTWTIASAAGGIQNFSADKFAINMTATNGTAGFANDTAGGVFSLAVAGNDLNLEFTPGGQQYLNASATAITTSQHYTTSNGGLTVNLALPVDLLAVGGGGGAGGANGSYTAGGGGGEALTASGVQVTAASNAVTVGGGGNFGGAAGSAGGSSTVLGITAAGGSGAVQTAVGGASGSGNAGGAASSGPPGGQAGGGGGGQTAVGSAGVYNATGPVRLGGDGGAGLTSSITGASLMYGFGGGGQAPVVNVNSGPGLNGDGTSDAPRANSGGGGWANTAGADGVVVIRYAGAQAATGGSITTDGSDTVHTFTADGTFAVTDVQSTLSGVIEGSGDFTFNGPGRLAVTAANTYAGQTIISAGTLQVGDGGTSGELGGTGSIANDGTLAFNRSDSVALARVISGTGSLTQAGSGTLTLSGANTYAGGTTISAGTLVGTATSLQGNIANAAALVFDDATGGTYSGVISGAGSFEKAGAGNVVLSGSNTFTGPLTVTAGTLSTNAAARLATNVAADVATGATLSLGGSQTLAVVTGGGTLDLSAGTLSMGGTTGEFAGTLTGAGNLEKTGAGTLTLSGTASSFTGNTTLSAGTLVLNNANALGTASVFSMAAGTTLTLNQRTYVGDVDQLGGTINGTGELVSTLFRTESGTLAAVIADDDGGVARGIRKISSGTTTVTAANTFTGTVRVDAGTLALGSGGSFASGSSALVEGGTLDLNGTSTTFTALDGTGGEVALGAGTLTINNANASAYSGVISGSGGSLVKNGGGNLVLSAAQTYSGPTSVTAGRLSVNGSLGNSAVTVQSGGELGGIGTLAGTVAVQGGGRLAPGNSIGVLTEGATSFASGSTFEYEVDSTNLGSLGSAADLLVVNGNLDIASGTLLEFSDLAAQAQAFAEDSTVFAMINYTGAWNGGLFTYGGQTLADGSRFFVGSQMWEIDYDYAYTGSNTQPLNWQGSHVPGSGTQTFVTVTAVPEPGTLALLAAAGLGLAVLARRRRK